MNDVIICISDGILEVTNTAGDMWDGVDLEEIVKAQQGKPAKDVVAAIVRRVRDYTSGTDQIDDMTISVIKILS